MQKPYDGVILQRFCLLSFAKVRGKVFRSLLSVTLFITLSYGSSAQMLDDSATTELIKAGVDYIYNFQFENAKKIYYRLNQQYPHHPIPLIFRGMITFWENYPLLADSPARSSFEDDMYGTISLCEANINMDHEAEFLMANLAARGMLLLFYADNGISREVVPLATSTYKYVRRAFDFKETYNDFYFITGLYNYYREAYPQAHPIYKAVAFLFPTGDKKLGLYELNLAAKNAIFLKAEAYSFLSGIYISFENDFTQASSYSEQLHRLYPENPLYIAIYIKNLLLIEQYDLAEKIIIEARKERQNDYLKVQLSILNGILYEKKYKNLRSAKSYYRSGLDKALKYSDYANEYAAYAYFGLSRIAAAENDQQAARMYRRLALDNTAYDNVNFD